MLWLIVAFFAGVFFGVLAISLSLMAKDDMPCAMRPGTER